MMTDTSQSAAPVTGMPRIGDQAPPFTATTTQGEVAFPYDFVGQWVILFSHPADFTPVCTSELMALAMRQDELARLNTKLVGLSVDGLYSHIAWLRTIKEKIAYRGMENVEVTFPLIDDATMVIAAKYGMIMPGEDSTKAVRAVFVIDPHGTIRAMIYYPLSLGRSFDELRRVVIALQTADAFEVSTPADWRPGDPVIMPPPGSCGTAQERMATDRDGVTCIDWFFCTQELSESDIDARLFSHRH